MSKELEYYIYCKKCNQNETSLIPKNLTTKAKLKKGKKLLRRKKKSICTHSKIGIIEESKWRKKRGAEPV